MEDFPSNSQQPKKKAQAKPKPDETDDKKVQPVVVGEVVRRKTPLSKRFSETFLGGQTEGVGGYVFFEVMMPALRDMVVDAGETGLRRLIIGETARPRSSGRRGSNHGYVNYGAASRDPRGRAGGRDEPRTLSRRDRSQHNIGEIILSTRAEAEEVLEQLYELISKYEIATVEDLYELVSITPGFTDQKWGWEDLRGARVVRDRDGYLLDLPRPDPIR